MKNILPYGLSLMNLRGNTADLIQAIEDKNSRRVLLCLDRLNKAISDYYLSEKYNFDHSSYVCRTYSKISESSLNQSLIVKKDAECFLKLMIIQVK